MRGLEKEWGGLEKEWKSRKRMHFVGKEWIVVGKENLIIRKEPVEAVLSPRLISATLDTEIDKFWFMNRQSISSYQTSSTFSSQTISSSQTIISSPIIIGSQTIPSSQSHFSIPFKPSKLLIQPSSLLSSMLTMSDPSTHVTCILRSYSRDDSRLVGISNTWPRHTSSEPIRGFSCWGCGAFADFAPQPFSQPRGPRLSNDSGRSHSSFGRILPTLNPKPWKRATKLLKNWPCNRAQRQDSFM